MLRLFLGILGYSAIFLAAALAADPKAELAQADRELNVAWGAVKKALSEEEMTELKEAQRQWVKYRDGSLEELDEASRAEAFAAAAQLTKDRTRWLQARAKREEDPLDGLWVDGSGGTLQIVSEPGKLLFVIDVVRGPTFHTGGISGVAVWNEPIGWFSDKGRDADKEDETNLSFHHKGLVVEIVGANTQYYHGARAYFDGRYVKAGSLTKAEQAEIAKEAKSGKKAEE